MVSSRGEIKPAVVKKNRNDVMAELLEIEDFKKSAVETATLREVT